MAPACTPTCCTAHVHSLSHMHTSRGAADGARDGWAPEWPSAVGPLCSGAVLCGPSAPWHTRIGALASESVAQNISVCQCGTRQPCAPSIPFCSCGLPRGLGHCSGVNASLSWMGRSRPPPPGPANTGRCSQRQDSAIRLRQRYHCHPKFPSSSPVWVSQLLYRLGKLFMHMRVGHGIILLDKKIGPAGLNFEKNGPVQIAVGVATGLRGCGCSTPPHTHVRSLASPRQGKAWHGWHGWHGLAWFGRVCV